MEKKKTIKELIALISMVDEPDEVVYGRIRQRIIDLGEEALPSLEKAWENSFEEFTRLRIQELLDTIHFESIQQQLITWVNSNQDDLLEGAILLSRYHFHELDINRITHNLGQIIQDVWLEMNDRMNPLEKIKVLNHILFDVHKFTPTKPPQYSLQDYLIPNLIDSKRGSGTTLGILYLIIAQSLKLPVYGVNLPYNMIIAYLENNPGIYIYDPENDPVLFYINPVFKGMIFIRKEIDRFLKDNKIEPQPQYFTACNNVQILQRLASEMRMMYDMEGDSEKAERMDQIIAILKS
ncbi:MAG: transglutaminase family protein [Bacteroidales bacterium]|jgi:regulator of sirC expression with transglutaminase-like and TPR domain|nr:transglutaminase family protein [Bacteroidales bacterium]MBP9511531.1 transglutaminase family protein [Bacteroidales bacterium]MBP9588264.1 transglutaminase family protein [Bacteroidales bacterium]HOU34517.1 transglutaminase-like domain-containing protein [Bacteroidales bacterium]HQF17845.1 transglutaminase-like domain-containing protein [Bacteroidales bacterium]